MGLAYFLPGFAVSGNPAEVAAAAGLLTLLNIFIRPGLKLLLGPFIILSFGLLIIVLNALLLYIVDIFSAGISIDGAGTLLIATLAISFINIIASISARSLFRD